MEVQFIECCGNVCHYADYLGTYVCAAVRPKYRLREFWYTIDSLRSQTEFYWLVDSDGSRFASAAIADDHLRRLYHNTEEGSPASVTSCDDRFSLKLDFREIFRIIMLPEVANSLIRERRYSFFQ